MFEDKFPRWLYWGWLITFIVVNSYFIFYLLVNGESFWSRIWQKFPGNWGNRFQSSFKQSFQNYFIAHAIIALIIKLSDYAKRQGVSYRTAHRMWKRSELKARQLPTGTISSLT